ncbi:MAG: 1-acyl-sn-glycerol-3-phosphate acyltransferase [Deltaproteobacteria bacterium]|nr:1-acyl-sn-glycerol-3-phosphate acyltransferase [Candidatus Tharpella aukensis]
MFSFIANLINAIRTIIVVVPNTCFWAIFCCLATFTPWSRRGVEFGGSCWGWINLRLNGVKVIYQGLENIDPHQTYMVIANHKSFLDIYTIFSCRALYCLFVAKRELTKIPIFGTALQRSGSIIIDRGNRKEAILRLQAQGKILKSRETSIVLFAEGTRGPASIRLGKFKKGGFMLASQLGLPILPLTISNSGNLQPKGKIAIKPGTITLTFSPAIESPEFNEEISPREILGEVNKVMEKTREAIDSHL